MLRSISLSHIWSRDGTWTMDGCEIDIEAYRHWDLIGVPIVHISGDLPMSIFACPMLAAWAWRLLRPVFQLTHVHDLSTNVLDNRAKKLATAYWETICLHWCILDAYAPVQSMRNLIYFAVERLVITCEQQCPMSISLYPVHSGTRFKNWSEKYSNSEPPSKTIQNLPTLWAQHGGQPVLLDPRSISFSWRSRL